EMRELEGDVRAQALRLNAAEQLAVRATTSRVSASSRTPSPSSVVFVSRPCSFSRRRTGTAASRLSPATKRAAPRRKPYRCTKRCRRELSAAARTRLRRALIAIPARPRRSARLPPAPQLSSHVEARRPRPRSARHEDRALSSRRYGREAGRARRGERARLLPA